MEAEYWAFSNPDQRVTTFLESIDDNISRKKSAKRNRAGTSISSRDRSTGAFRHTGLHIFHDSDKLLSSQSDRNAFCFQTYRWTNYGRRDLFCEFPAEVSSLLTVSLKDGSNTHSFVSSP